MKPMEHALRDGRLLALEQRLSSFGSSLCFCVIFALSWKVDAPPGCQKLRQSVRLHVQTGVQEVRQLRHQGLVVLRASSKCEGTTFPKVVIESSRACSAKDQVDMGLQQVKRLHILRIGLDASQVFKKASCFKKQVTAKSVQAPGSKD